jgi:hypothetical protein
MRPDAETVERLYAEKLAEVAEAAAEIEDLARRWEGRNDDDGDADG